MKDYDVRGTIFEGKKAVIAVAIPKPQKDNVYFIHKTYNISSPHENRIVIHFKDSFGVKLVANGNFEAFVIDLNSNDFLSLDFSKKIKVAFHHENDELRKTPEKIFEDVFKDPIVTPDSTGRGTIREGEEDSE
ncbi:hypothetical protein [Flavobacterium sp. 3-210]